MPGGSTSVKGGVGALGTGWVRWGTGWVRWGTAVKHRDALLQSVTAPVPGTGCTPSGILLVGYITGQTYCDNQDGCLIHHNVTQLSDHCQSLVMIEWMHGCIDGWMLACMVAWVHACMYS